MVQIGAVRLQGSSTSCTLGSGMGWGRERSSGEGTGKWDWGRVGWSRMVDGVNKVVGLVPRGQAWGAACSQPGDAREGPSQHELQACTQARSKQE